MARNYVFVGIVVSGFVFGMGCTYEDPNSLTRDVQTSANDLRANKGKGTTQRCAPSSDDGADDGDVSPHCDAGTSPAPAPSTTSAAPAPSTTSTAPAAAPAPATCTSFTYSAWGACQPDGTQTRTVASSSPSGCTGGSPVTAQPCTSLDGAALYTQYCSGCHGTSKIGSSATSIQNAIDTIGAMKSLSTLTPEQIAAIAAAK